MEDSPITTPCEDDWAQEIAETLGQQRSRVREFLTAQRARLDQARLQLADELNQQQESQVSELSALLKSQIDEHYQKLCAETGELQAALAEQRKLVSEIDSARGRETKLNDRIEDLRAERDELAEQLRQQHNSEVVDQFRQLQQQTGELQAALAAQKELFAEIESGRAREAELTEQLEALRRQYDQIREEASQAAQEAGVDSGQLEALRAERDELAERLRQQQKSEVAEFSAELKSQIEAQYQQLQQQTGELQAALAAQRELLAEIETGRGREAELNEQLEALRAERDELAERLKQQQKSEVAEFSAELKSQIDAQYQEIQQRTADLQSALAGQKELLTEIESAHGREAELNEQLEKLRRQYDQLREEASRAAQEAGVDSGQLEALRAERDELAEQLRQQQKSEVAEFSAELKSQIDSHYQQLQQRTDDLQSALAGQKELLAQIDAGRNREAELNEQLDQLRRQHDQLREEASRAAQEAGVDTGQLEALRAERDELIERQRQQRESEVAELSAQLKSQIDSQYHELQQQTTELQAALAGQRELLAEIESGRSREMELGEQIEALQTLQKQLREEASATEHEAGVDTAQFEQLRSELSERLRQQQEQQIAELSGQLRDQIEQQYDRLHQQTAELQIALASQSELIAEVEAGRNRELELREQLETFRGQNDQLREAAPIAGQHGDTDKELERRYEMALDDLRELKARNEELEQQIAHSEKSASSSAGADLGGLDWEAQKRRLLASLESDCDENDEEEQDRRLEVQEVVRKTDAVVADRDREIRELKQLLETQSKTHKEVAVGAAALGDVLDEDAVIQEERQKLQALQRQWEEKFRTAELELSVERARLARQRSEVDERLRVLEERGGEADEPSGGDSSADGEPKRGRWLARLGLKDPEADRFNISNRPSAGTGPCPRRR